MKKQCHLPVCIFSIIVALTACFLVVQFTSRETQDRYSCTSDSDCVPSTCCHPRECVNILYKPNCEDMACTLMFDYQAAYSPEDCACIDNKCINENLGRTTE